MKSIASLRSCLSLSALALLACSEWGVAAKAAPLATDAGLKTHVLFIGADVSVEKDKKLYHVDDVAGDSFIVTINKQPVRIPTDKTTMSIKVDQRMQVTDRKAVVAGLKGDRAYTFGADPVRRRSLEAVELMTAMEEGVERAHIKAEIARNKAGAGGRSPNGDPMAGRSADDAERAEDNFRLEAASDFGTGREQMMLAQAELAKELYDAIEVTFTVSSTERLAEAYVVLIARIRDPESKPGAVRNWIYAKSIGEVTDSPRDIHIKHGGFIPGFLLEGYDLHLYSAGREVATNVSPKRVELTKEDAAQYSLIDYLSAHKEATLPPTPALGRLPKDYYEHLGGPTSPKVCYVKVTPDGVPTEIYIDPSCSQKLADEYIETVLKQIWFKPALEKGKPVAGVAKVKLAALTM